MRSHAQLPHLTVEEYLEGELRSPVKHEYVAGQVFAMTGATLGHNRIIRNLVIALESALKGGPCQVYFTDIKVHVSHANAFYYPDILVDCESTPARSHVIERPVLIVEVLSPSTEKIDRREKLLAYQKLDSLREYVLVGQDEREVTVYRRDDQGQWWQDIYGGEGTLRLESIGADLSLAGIYEGA
jgi:Uma2 family endonuclease